MSTLYRLVPLRILRRTPGVLFDEIVPSDIPKIHGVDRVGFVHDGSLGNMVVRAAVSTF